MNQENCVQKRGYDADASRRPAVEIFAELEVEKWFAFETTRRKSHKTLG